MMKKIRLGFTLIELVAVMLLIAILSVALIPSFNNNSYQAFLAADEIIGALRYARQIAVDTGCQVAVGFPSSSSVTLSQATGGNSFNNLVSGGCTSTFNQNVANPVTGSSSYSITTPTGITLSSANGSIVFDAWGRAWPGARTSFTGTQTITITGNGETLYTIYVEGASGYAHL